MVWLTIARFASPALERGLGVRAVFLVNFRDVAHAGLSHERRVREVRSLLGRRGAERASNVAALGGLDLVAAADLECCRRIVGALAVAADGALLGECVVLAADLDRSGRIAVAVFELLGVAEAVVARLRDHRGVLASELAGECRVRTADDRIRRRRDALVRLGDFRVVLLAGLHGGLTVLAAFLSDIDVVLHAELRTERIVREIRGGEVLVRRRVGLAGSGGVATTHLDVARVVLAVRQLADLIGQDRVVLAGLKRALTVVTILLRDRCAVVGADLVDERLVARTGGIGSLRAREHERQRSHRFHGGYSFVLQKWGWRGSPPSARVKTFLT